MIPRRHEQPDKRPNHQHLATNLSNQINAVSSREPTIARIQPELSWRLSWRHSLTHSFDLQWQSSLTPFLAYSICLFIIAISHHQFLSIYFTGTKFEIRIQIQDTAAAAAAAAAATAAAAAASAQGLEMTKKEDFYINFSGFAHDHTTQEPSSGGGGRDQRPSQHHNGDQTPDAGAESNNQCSVIAILRRHPMYDSLVLVKKYRACLNGYSLEFPVDDDEDDNDEDEPDSCRGGEASLSTDSSEPQPHKTAAAAAAAAAGPLSKCSRRRLVSRLIDGDDPKFQHYLEGNAPASAAGQPAPAQLAPSAGGPLSRSASGADIIDPVHPFSQQSDDRGTDCQFVHVPLNGLLHRLKHFTESGLAVDSRVYSFAMGLKFAERILTTNSMKEVQETPI